MLEWPERDNVNIPASNSEIYWSFEEFWCVRSFEAAEFPAKTWLEAEKTRENEKTLVKPETSEGWVFFFFFGKVGLILGILILS